MDDLELSEKIKSLVENYLDKNDVPEAKRIFIRMSFVYSLHFMGFILNDENGGF